MSAQAHFIDTLNDAEAQERGQLICDVLCLHPDPKSRGRYHTQWGSKTPLGIFRTVERLIIDGE